jgi:hypothetical protein
MIKIHERQVMLIYFITYITLSNNRTCTKQEIIAWTRMIICLSFVNVYNIYYIEQQSYRFKGMTRAEPGWSQPAIKLITELETVTNDMGWKWGFCRTENQPSRKPLDFLFSVFFFSVFLFYFLFSILFILIFLDMKILNFKKLSKLRKCSNLKIVRFEKCSNLKTVQVWKTI